MTKPSNYLSLELSKALHEKGVRIESEHYHCWNGSYSNVDGNPGYFIMMEFQQAKEYSEYIPAPTATELAEWVDKHFDWSTVAFGNEMQLIDRSIMKLAQPEGWYEIITALLDKGIIQPITA